MTGSDKFKQKFGAWGESRAEEYLIKQGLIPLARNYRTKFGEIDLVMLHDEMVVFVEVKTRSNNLFGLPEEAVSKLKQDHLIQAAHQYLDDREENRDWRVDVISIRGKMGSDSPEIVWFENALA